MLTQVTNHLGKSTVFAPLAAPAVIGMLCLPAMHAQSPTPAPKFDVVSIKTCTGEPAPIPGRKGARGGRVSASPGRLTAECATLATLVRTAYIQFPEGKPQSFVSPRIMQQEIKGRPSWYDSDRYTITATTEGPQSREMLLGPMLQDLLKERFQLQTHSEPRDVPIYELRIAKNGSKLQPAKPGSCVVFDRDHPPPPNIGPGSTPICGGFSGDKMYGSTMENLCRQLTVTLDRDVIDKTGLTGQFDIRFEWPPPDLAAGDVAPSNPPDPSAQERRFATNLEAAIPKLGLILQPAKGSGTFLVIDHVEKPKEN